MKKILFVNACMRGAEQSRTWKLCQSFLKCVPGALAGGGDPRAGSDRL